MKLLMVLLTVPLFAAPVHIYVANSEGDNISIIDPATNRVTGEIRVSKNPHGIVASADGKRFYVSSETENVLDVVDRASSAVIRRVPLGRRPNNLAITPDGRRIYICIRGEDCVDIVDAASLEKVKRVPFGAAPHNVYATPDGRWMLATSMDERKITAINVQTEKPEFDIPVGGVPRPLVIEPGPGGRPERLFVQLSDLHGFVVVDFAARSVIHRVLLPDAPANAVPLIPHTLSHGIGIAPDGKTLWVASMLDSSISVFRLPGLKRLATVPIGHAPDWLTFTPDSRRCYVSNAGANSVSAIDAVAYREITRIPVGKVPKRIITAD